MPKRTLVVVEPGLLTTVQDLGRPGLMRFGVTPGGALDRSALVLGNLLVGNDRGAAALELTLIGPRLRFTQPVVAALSGADLGATLNGAAPPRWLPFPIAAGGELAFRPTGTGGARAYLCIAGGIAVDAVMGSRSTDLFGGFGGWHGRSLQTGDELPLGQPSAADADLLRRRLATPPPAFDPDEPVRVVLGPQSDRFTDEGRDTFLTAGYVVSPQSDRMGIRLTGPAVAHSRGADLISEGIAHGAVQVPGDGQPIVLLAARQTVGGYPKIATVIAADLDALGQRRPGAPIRFSAVDPPTARALALADQACLGDGAVIAAGRPSSGWTADHPEPAVEDGAMASSWDAEGVARLVAALRDAGVSSFRLELASAGLKLEVDWRAADAGTAGPSLSDSAPTARERGTTDDSNVVTAPLLGIFYRRPGPDQPPFVEEGQAVAAGQTLGLIEVMKTYHEVTAPRVGTLAAFLAEDGAYVEYGQALARLDPVAESGEADLHGTPSC